MPCAMPGVLRDNKENPLRHRQVAKDITLLKDMLKQLEKAYIATTLERFANPFLDHRLADIYGGHTAKVEKRIGGFIRWVEGSGKAVAMPELRALAARPG